VIDGHLIAALAGSTVCLAFIGFLGIGVAYAAKAPAPSPKEESTC
jgi:hypothetical protein